MPIDVMVTTAAQRSRIEVRESFIALAWLWQTRGPASINEWTLGTFRNWDGADCERPDRRARRVRPLRVGGLSPAQVVSEFLPRRVQFVLALSDFWLAAGDFLLVAADL